MDRNMTSLGKTVKKNQKDVFLELSVNYPHLDFSEFIYVNNTTPGKITCKIHNHIYFDCRKNISRTKNGGCKYCSGTGINAKKTTEDFIKDLKYKFEKSIDRFDLSRVTYVNAFTPISIVCKDHGEIVRTPTYFLNTKGNTPCPFCNVKQKCIDQFDTSDTFKKKFINRYGENVLDLKNLYYISSKDNCKFICNNGHIFYSRPNDILNRGTCPKCSEPGSSEAQLELEVFLSSIASNVFSKVRLRNKQEVDILLPEFDLAIEFNGLWWHREDNLSKEYHLSKTEYCKGIGIRLIHIFEDEWIYKKDIVKAKLTHLLKKSNETIYARKTKVREITGSESFKFLDKNHIQGNCPSSINLGLYADSKLIAVMTFGSPRFNNEVRQGEYELLRYCCVGSVVGGFSKLLSYFIKKHSPVRILSYSDKRWSEGDVYLKNGFKYLGRTEPAESWCKNQKRLTRFQTMKHKLVNWPYFDKNLTADQILIKNGWYKIWDCGCDKWEIAL